MMDTQIPRCQSAVHHRDQHRYTGWGKTGFTMTHSKKQCVRRSIAGSDYCTQHTKGYSFPYGPVAHRFIREEAN